MNPRNSSRDRKTRQLFLCVITLFMLFAAGCAGEMSMDAGAPAAPPGGVNTEWQYSDDGADALRAEELGSWTDTSSGALPQAAGSEEIERLVVRNGSLEIVVPDTEEALDAITTLAGDLGGFVLNSDVREYQQGYRGNITIKIPVDDFDEAMQAIRDLATDVRYETTSASDVTEEYVDLQSSLRNREATQERLLSYLEDAEDTEAVLAVDQQLRQIEAEIEQIKGRIQYLEQSAAMSTINVTVIPDELAQPIEVAGWNPEGTLRDAIEALIKFWQWLADVIITAVVLYLPAIITLGLPVAVIVYIVRRRRRKSE